MKRFLSILLATAFMLALPMKGLAADPTASASGEIYADVLSAYAVTKGSSLNFGRLIPSTTATGTLVVNAAGTTATETNVVKAAGHTFSAASFTISSSTNVNWSVAPIAAQTLTHETDAARTMTVSSFQLSATSGNTSTNNTFTVGATLNVGANQEIGRYTGSFPVVVTFN